MKILCQGIVSGGEVGFLFLALRKLELFSSLTDVQLYKILQFMRSVEFEAGETVFKKGAAGDSFYVIQRGKVQARVPGFLGFSKTLATMGPSEFFGELALILQQPRAATIVCVEKTACFVLDRGDLQYVMRRNPDMAATIEQIARKRLGGKA